MAVPLEILIVEDEMLLTMDMEAMIEDSGHHVVAEAASVRDVAALPLSIQPDVAFVDIHLADDSSGLDACRLIRERWPQTLIVFVTANVSKIPEDFCGAHGVIAKPFSHSGIVNAIRYLAEGVYDPPPSSPKPSSLIPSPHLEARWQGTPVR